MNLEKEKLNTVNLILKNIVILFKYYEDSKSDFILEIIKDLIDRLIKKIK